MKISCSTKTLRDAVGLLGTVCPPRSPKPVLSHLRLTRLSGAFSLQATDLEVWARILWDGKGPEDLDLLLPAGSVGGLLKETTDEEIEIEEKEKGIELRTRDTRVRFPRVPAVEFPAWPEMHPEGSFQVTASALISALRRTAFAAAQEKSRYALNGVLVALAGPGKPVEWVATDSRRLSLVRHDVVTDPSGEGRAILALKMVGLAERAFADSRDLIRVAFDRRFARIGSGVVEILGRLVEGAYPDYRAVVPKGFPEKEKVCCKPAELERAVRKAALVTSATAGSIGWRLDDGMLEVSGQSPEEGEVKVSLPVHYKGEGLAIRFNPSFLLDALRVASGGADREREIEVELRDATCPALIHLAEDTLYVVLPVHLVP